MLSNLQRALIRKLGPMGFQEWAREAPLHSMRRWPTASDGVWIITKKFRLMCPACDANGRDEDCCSPYKCYQDWNAVHLMTPPVIPQEEK